MPWVDRNGRKYFYFTPRQDNKIRKIYVGCGDAGRAAELALECRRDQRRAVRDWLRNAATKFEELDKIDAELTVGLAAVLFAECGIGLDARAARRINRKQKEMVMEETVREINLTPAEREMWQQLCEQITRGDRAAAAALFPFLEKHSQLKDRLGDLSLLALKSWLDLVAGRNEIGKRTIHAKVLRLIDSLRRDADDPLERLLTQRVGLLWLQLKYVDIQLAEAMSRTVQKQQFLAKRRVATHQMHTAATQTLQDYQARGGMSSQASTRKPAPR